MKATHQPIGTRPVVALAPLDYRYALDAAMPLLAGPAPPLVHCRVPELTAEIEQRLPRMAGATAEGSAPAALWVEPPAASWGAELRVLAAALPPGAPLVIIASRPLARLLPERRSWPGRPLGLTWGGVERLCRALPRAGFALEARHGVHSTVAIVLNLVGQAAARAGRPDLGDRLHFAARLRYHTTGPFAALATVALLLARKGRG